MRAKSACIEPRNATTPEMQLVAFRGWLHFAVLLVEQRNATTPRMQPGVKKICSHHDFLVKFASGEVLSGKVSSCEVLSSEVFPVTFCPVKFCLVKFCPANFVW
jgi:hypothetical protein